MVLYCERCAGFFYFCVNFTIVYSILKSCHFFYCQNPFIGTKRFQERGRKRLLICMCVMWAWACVRGMTSITLWTWFDYDTCINTAQITCDFCWRNRERAITLPCFRSNVVFFLFQNVRQFILCHWNKCRRFGVNIVLLFLWNVIQLNSTEQRIQ